MGTATAIMKDFIDEENIRLTGTGVDISIEPTPVQPIASGNVLINEYGMLVLVGNNNSNPSFISLCKAEIVTK